MASQAYYDWVRAGKPYNRSAPVMQLRDVLRSHGYTVYDYPDEAHQKANLPQDHTAYSATGWPVSSPRWWAFGIDQMPGKGGMSDLADVAMQIIKDKDAGVPGTEWIKYINWTDKSGKCWHTSWKPNKSTVPSDDKGHNHISGRSDFTSRTTVKYDPVARMRGQVTTGRQDEDMAIIARGPDGKVYFCSANRSYPIPETSVGDRVYLAGQGAYFLARGPVAGDAEWEKGGIIRKGWSENIFGIVDTGDLQSTRPHGWALATRVEAMAKMMPKSQTGEDIKMVSAIEAGASGGDAALPVDVATVKAGVTAALKDEENQAVLVDTAFRGSQKAEQE